MTKQEEIREVIDIYVDDGCLYPDKTCAWCSKEGYCASDEDAYKCLMKRLDGLGVVIKVERELSKYHGGYVEYEKDANGEYDWSKPIFYVAVEPLIEGGLNEYRTD